MSVQAGRTTPLAQTPTTWRLHKTLVFPGVQEVDGETCEKAIGVFANLGGEDSDYFKNKRSITILHTKRIEQLIPVMWGLYEWYIYR